MRKGFTLIELLVVVLIIGILASVAMPQYFKSVAKARSTEAITILEAIASAEERHYMKTGTYASLTNPALEISITPNEDGELTTPNFYLGELQEPTRMRISASSDEYVAGGLGYYVINLYIPFPPGTGERTWDCFPTSAGCKSFLPK